MKKTMKKIASLVLAMAMVFAMAMPAMAAGDALADTTRSIKIKETKSGHKYYAYQIFSGTLSSDGVLSNITEGTGVTKEGIGALKEAFFAIFQTTDEYKKNRSKYSNASDMTLNDLATAIAAEQVSVENGKNSPNAKLVAETLAQGGNYLVTDTGKKGPASYVENTEPHYYEFASLPIGYYLIIDDATDNPLQGTEKDAYSSYMVKITKEDLEITPKSPTPTVDKTVSDDDGEEPTLSDTADHEINETFQFHLKATIPDDENLEDYENYKVVFHDTLSKGVAFEGIGSDEAKKLKVTVKVGTDNSVELTSGEYEVEPTGVTDGTEETKLTITIEDLFELATGNLGETIKNNFGKKIIEIEVTYDAHLTKDAVAATSGDNVTAGDESNTNKVYLEYTNEPYYEGDGEPSTGHTPEDTVFVFTYDSPHRKTDGGTDAKDPEDFAKIKDARFTLYKGNSTSDEDKIYLKKDGDNYYPVDQSELGDDQDGTIAPNPNTGEFNIKGLDEGKYTLSETTVPEGYNKCEDITIEITDVTHKESAEGTASVTFERKINGGENVADNVIDIENNEGTTLPETGGIGTTIFYVVGSVLVLAAAVLLVTKRRMSAE